jgi:hypothetical protein
VKRIVKLQISFLMAGFSGWLPASVRMCSARLRRWSYGLTINSVSDAARFAEHILPH